MNDSDRIGYLIAFPGFTGVCCQECLDGSDMADAKDPTPVALYRVNVGPYKQTCHGCGKVLVEARSHHWPELFVRTAACTECPSAGLPSHDRHDDVTKTCAIYLRDRDSK